MTKYTDRSKTLPEIFDKVRSFEKTEDKVEYLKRFRTKQLEFFVWNLYNEDWSCIKIPYEFQMMSAPPGLCYSTIANSINKLKAAKNLAESNPKRSTDLIQQVLESVSADEAVLLIRLFNGQKVPGISKSIFKEVYPHFFNAEEE